MLAIELSEEAKRCEPGGEISGNVSWTFDFPPQRVELRLFWRTEGRGSTDVGLVETVAFENPGVMGKRPFRLRLPESPYSFSGKLISLIWSLELVEQPGGEVAREDFIMGPKGEEVRIGA
jgi:hypothetical protein